MNKPLCVFTYRNQELIHDRKITVSFRQKLNKRVWLIINKFDCRFDKEDFTGYRYRESLLELTESKLKEVYGIDNFYINNEGELEFKDFIEKTYPSKVLDVIETFYYVSYIENFSSSFLNEFTMEINQAFEDARAPWRLTAGRFYKADPEFLELKIREKTNLLLEEEELIGAFEEFQEAKNDLKTDDFKDSILKSTKSMESVLKVILNRDDGVINELLEELKEIDFFEDIPEKYRGGFVGQVLKSAPFLRNNIAGHGQGKEVIEIPAEYAELSVNLSGAIIQFLIKKYNKFNLSNCEEELEFIEEDDFEIPLDDDSDDFEVPF